MSGPYCSLLDPLSKHSDLVIGDRIVSHVGRWHASGWVVARNPLEQHARFRRSAHYSPTATCQLIRRSRFRIEAQPGLALRFVRPVAAIAPIREDRPYVAVVVNPFRSLRPGESRRWRPGGPYQ